ncbi:MAG: hypothetical protein WBP29_08395 [Candidatus Zixiibacteriota bacterium]
MNSFEEDGGVAKHPATIRIAGILVTFLAFACLPSCGDNSQDFERAEKAFNSGILDSAVILYQDFIEKQPTSKWRSVADKQLDKCREILTLKTEAARLASQNQFEDAKDRYREIATLNRLAIDTMELFLQLDSNRYRFEEALLKKKAEDEEVARRIQAESDQIQKKAAKLVREQEEQFLDDLSWYLLTLKAHELTVMTAVVYVHQLLDTASDGEFYEKLFAKSIDFAIDRTKLAEAETRMDDYYAKIRTAPLKYRDCSREIDSSYEAYWELRRELDNVRNYPARGFLERLVPLHESIRRSISILNLYVPDDSSIKHLLKIE